MNVTATALAILTKIIVTATALAILTKIIADKINDYFVFHFLDLGLVVFVGDAVVTTATNLVKITMNHVNQALLAKTTATTKVAVAVQANAKLRAIKTRDASKKMNATA